MRANHAPADQPLNPGQEFVERLVTECEDVIPEVAWNGTQQVQNHLSRQELQLVERIDEMRS